MSQTFYCRWDFCPRIFNSLSSLRDHFVNDHIPTETAVYVPAHKRRRREDGGWETVADLSDLSSIQANVSINMTAVTSSSNRSSDPSFAVPSLPASFNYTQELGLPGAPLGSTGILGDEAVGVDYDAFLRSPSPIASYPVQSTPLSQVPPESQQPTNPELAENHSSASQHPSTSSSAQHVSPARGMFATQAIPPPSATPLSQRTTSTGNNGSPASMQIAFGSAASGAAGTPARRISASGFSWGMSEK